MEIGRTKLLEAIGMSTQDIFKQGFAPVLVQTNITYKSLLYLGDRVSVQMWLSKLGKASAIVQFQFHASQAKLAAEGWQKGLFIDRVTMRPLATAPGRTGFVYALPCRDRALRAGNSEGVIGWQLGP